jgi:hypothetical protein
MAKEIKINPAIVLDMAEKYRIPLNPTKLKDKQPDQAAAEPMSGDNSGSLQNRAQPKTNEAETIRIEDTLRDLVNNKHNDLTTTYYLLHKEWLQGLESNRDQRGKDLQSMLVTLTHANYHQIAFKLQNQLELKINSSPDRAKNLLKLSKEGKLAESASLVIKSPVVAFQNHPSKAN